MNTTEMQSLQIMQRQLEQMRRNPALFERLIAGGMVCAGFGGDLNGVQVPETFLHGTLPPGVTPRQALEQVMQIMQRTIEQAARVQRDSDRSVCGTGEYLLEA